VQSVDAVGKLATDVATLQRTEIGELAEGSGGGSSAMPQKQNPVASVLIRSAALRAPGLASTLHLAAALAGDERPDGAWHAEWPTLRELLRLALGATALAASLAEGLRFDADAAARNLAATRGLVLSERLSLVLGPVLGADAVAQIVTDVTRGAVLVDAVRRALTAAAPAGADLDVARLLDPTEYTGLAASLVDEVTSDVPEERA
jgi:3-carboxy-cis,cis-muconate cycloisomerase